MTGLGDGTLKGMGHRCGVVGELGGGVEGGERKRVEDGE